MVATQGTQPIRKLTAPMTIMIEGSPRVFSTHGAIIDALRSLERSEIGLNHQAALAAFHLGRGLIDTARALGYGHLNHLYNEAGINGRRAERAIRFAKLYTDKDGGFDLAKYRDGECKARNRHDSGESKCTFDEDGNPSLTAVMRAEGLRPDSKAKNATSDPRVGTKTRTSFDPMAMLDDAGAQYQSNQNEHHAAGGFRIAEYAGATGEQLSLDFNLRVTEQRLAVVINDADLAYTAGAISDEQAAAINEAMERFTEQVRSITEHNQHTTNNQAINNRATH